MILSVFFVAAQALHRRSAQKGRPFVSINCNTIPENLLESELFGHEKAAFTGAHAQRKRYIETAARGTLFLDEIGEAIGLGPGETPAYLQEKCFQRVDGRQEVQSDAASSGLRTGTRGNWPSAESSARTLYFPLAVVVVKVRPRAGAGDDIVPVAKAFLHNDGIEHGKPCVTFAPDALRALSVHRWPGNVRKLRNRVQRRGHHGGWQAHHRPCTWN